MSERIGGEGKKSRVEVLDARFFAGPVLSNGKIVPAPKEALDYYAELHKNWYLTHPKSRQEIPCLRLHPGRDGEREGYTVERVIIYR